jgi:hypothetical protein
VTPAGMGKVRLFAHPDNPDARAAAQSAKARAAAKSQGAGSQPIALRQGTLVPQGTVLGRVSLPEGATDGHLQFAIRPAGDSETIDPRPILSNWVELYTALHPRGAKQSSLSQATASQLFLITKSRLQSQILSDPGITASPCSRSEIASGAIDARVLALTEFLSRSDLKPTIATLRCGQGAYALKGYVSTDHAGDALAITHINGVPIAAHQGAGSVTDTTIRTLLSLPGKFIPEEIGSLMHYPGQARTLAQKDHGAYIEISFPPAPAVKAVKAAKAKAAHAGKSTPPVNVGDLSSAQWEALIARIGALPVPSVSAKPSSSAIPDP